MTFDTLRLDKGLYTSEKGFTKSLEEIDPSENYKGTELEGLDAYERQLKRFDIKVKGGNSDPVSKFFQTSDSAVLFPEYIKRSVEAAINTNNIIDDMIATTTIIDSLDYRSVYCKSIDRNGSIDYINEGSFIPETEIKVKQSLTKLKKSGRTIVASYESIKSQRLDLFAIMLKQIGNYINTCQLEQVIRTIDTDDTRNVISEAVNKIGYNDFANLYALLSPYNFDAIIAGPMAFVDIINIPEFKDATAGHDFHGTGNLVTPFGAKFLFSKSELLEKRIFALDKRFALEKVQFGEVVTDFDKLIDRQIERATVTATAGFNRIIDEACVVIDPKV